MAFRDKLSVELVRSNISAMLLLLNVRPKPTGFRNSSKILEGLTVKRAAVSL